MNRVKYYNKSQFLPGNRKHYFDSNTECNSLNYRTKEFDNIDWSNSVVIFGCSNVFGRGLTDEETISFHLEKLLGRPVINMGVCGSSINYSVFNQVVLSEKCPAPYTVVNLWTSISRLLYFLDDAPKHIGPWNEQFPKKNIQDLSLSTLFQSWNIVDTNPELHSLFFQRIAEVLWRDTQHIQGTFFLKTSEVLNVKKYNYIDFAEDKIHPGPLTAKSVAEDLALRCR